MNDARGKFPSIKPNLTLRLVFQSINNSYAPFIEAIGCHPDLNLLNEKSLVQEFVTQNDIQLRSLIDSIRVDKEYIDTFYKSKGIPDIAYIPLEEGSSHRPIFIIEAKILPAPDHKSRREKEYVIGDHLNGGIERYKIGKHGFGMNFCGLMGFINDSNTINAWVDKINSWIYDLSSNDSFWSSEEFLEREEGSNLIHSIAKRGSDVVNLYHFFIKIKL